MQTDPPALPTSGKVFYARAFALLTLFILGLLLYQILLPFFAPLAWALFIAFLLHPLHTWLVHKLGGRASLSSALLTLATLLMLLGPFAALGAAFVAQVADLLHYIQQLAGGRRALADLTQLPIVGSVLTWVQETFGVTLAQIQGWIIEATRNLLQLLAPLGGRIFIGALGTVVSFVLMMVMLFFMIRDGEHMVGAFRALVPLPPVQKTRLFDHLASVTRAVFFGSGVTALVQGALVGIGFLIVGLPSPVVFAVLAALFALIPLAGTPVVWVPAVLVLAAQQRWVAAIFLLVFGLIIATIDNFLRPLLVSGRAPVAALTVFIGVLGGVSAFGALGLFLGPLVLSLVIALIRFTLEMRDQEEGKQALTDSGAQNGE